MIYTGMHFCINDKCNIEFYEIMFEKENGVNIVLQDFSISICGKFKQGVSYRVNQFILFSLEMISPLLIPDLLKTATTFKDAPSEADATAIFTLKQH